jgi:hypothetical protein
MYAGDRFSYKDHGYTRYVAQQSIDFIRNTGPTGRALVLTPWLRHVLPKASGFKQIRNSNIKVVEAIKVSRKNFMVVTEDY